MHQKAFFRDARGNYYSATPVVSGQYSETVVHWLMKGIGKEDKTVVTTRELQDHYEACSPYEALGSHLL